MAKTYEPDEFDRIAQQGGPLGVHRATRPWWAAVLPVFLAFIIAGLVAFGVATYFWEQDVRVPILAPTPTSSPTPQPIISLTPEPSPTPSETPEPSPEPEPEPVINLDVNVTVLNAAGIGGLAGQNQVLLEDEGFTNVTASNLTSGLPDENTVLYRVEGQADTAARIAEILGIDAVEMGDTPTGNAIDVILVTDPAA